MLCGNSQANSKFQSRIKKKNLERKKLAFDMKEKNVVFEIVQSLQKYFVSSFKENLYLQWTMIMNRNETDSLNVPSWLFIYMVGWFTNFAHLQFCVMKFPWLRCKLMPLRYQNLYSTSRAEITCLPTMSLNNQGIFKVYSRSRRKNQFLI